jgi:hypothetical protein
MVFQSSAVLLAMVVKLAFVVVGLVVIVVSAHGWNQW